VLEKRANKLLMTGEGDILVGDKFGDLYRYPLLSPPPLPVVEPPKSKIHISKHDLPPSSTSVHFKHSVKKGQDGEKTKPVSMLTPVLGHVSLLTDVVLGEGFVVTSDRDEHIRISEWPEGWRIRGWCGGSRKFVGSLLLLDDLLLSAGGDNQLLIFDPNTCALVNTVDLSILSNWTTHTRMDLSSKQDMKIMIKRRERELIKVDERNKGGRNGKKDMGKKEDKLRLDAVDEEELEAGEEGELPNLCITLMRKVEGGVVLMNAGSSLLSFIPISLIEAKMEQKITVVDLKHPVLYVEVDSEGLIWVCLDFNVGVSSGENHCLRVLKVVDNQLVAITDDPLINQISELTRGLLPDTTEESSPDLYSDLMMYSKRAIEADRFDEPPKEKGAGIKRKRSP